MFIENTKVLVYHPCDHGTFLYGSIDDMCESGKHFNSFHLGSLRRILGITWQEHPPNKDVFQRAHIPSIFALLTQRRPSVYGELASGTRIVSSAVRGCLQDKQNCSDQHRVLGICYSRPQQLATSCAECYREGRRRTNELWTEKSVGEKGH